ncbi:RsfA family transcriptional regulator [Bacillaceae bacterium IKA-2]|nr:RsfA family transcriptional regulator [Bacillaceae bacterium IKA-2]
MSIVRQDAWTNDEDLVLAEVALRHIREGSTQLAAFEEVGERLSRTAAACGFRWNSSIRKKYDAAIVIAKKQRKNLKKTKLADDNYCTPFEIVDEVADGIGPRDQDLKSKESKAQISIDEVITFLTAHRASLSSNNVGSEDYCEHKDEVTQLKNENKKLLNAYTLLQESYDMIKQDYQLLIQIMERAKQMSITKG